MHVCGVAKCCPPHVCDRPGRPKGSAPPQKRAFLASDCARATCPCRCAFSCSACEHGAPSGQKRGVSNGHARTEARGGERKPEVRRRPSEAPRERRHRQSSHTHHPPALHTDTTKCPCTRTKTYPLRSVAPATGGTRARTHRGSTTSMARLFARDGCRRLGPAQPANGLGACKLARCCLRTRLLHLSREPLNLREGWNRRAMEERAPRRLGTRTCARSTRHRAEEMRAVDEFGAESRSAFSRKAQVARLRSPQGRSTLRSS